MQIHTPTVWYKGRGVGAGMIKPLPSVFDIAAVFQNLYLILKR